jgi:hypothetical protein
MEAVQETTALVLNITGSILSPNENIFKATQIETTGTHAPTGTNSHTQSSSASSTTTTTTTTAIEQPPLTSLVDSTSRDRDEIRSVIECIPYLDHTKIDTLPAVRDRFLLPNKAEPELIKVFQKNKNNERTMSIEGLKKQLIRIKREVYN